MKPALVRTARRFAISSILFFLWLISVAYVEFKGIQEGAPITDLIRLAFISEPGMILLIVVIIAGLEFYFGGHWFAAGPAEYKKLEDENKDG